MSLNMPHTLTVHNKNNCALKFNFFIVEIKSGSIIELLSSIFDVDHKTGTMFTYPNWTVVAYQGWMWRWLDVGRPRSLVNLLDGGPGSGTGTAGRGRTAHVRHTAGHTCILVIVSYAFET